MLFITFNLVLKNWLIRGSKMGSQKDQNKMFPTVAHYWRNKFKMPVKLKIGKW